MPADDEHLAQEGGESDTDDGGSAERSP